MRSLGPNHALVVVACLAASVAALGSISCDNGGEVQTRPYFDRNIQPVLTHSCSRQTTGCHVADGKGNALGNLDTTSFENVDRRRDLLITYGPYSAPGLLTKTAGPQVLSVSTLEGPVSITTDIRHAAGAGLDITSEGYATLKRWMDNGASEANTGPLATKLVPAGGCMTNIPDDPRYDKAAPDEPLFDQFKSKVQPVLAASCSAASCHGNIVADLSLTCGSTPEQQKWNAWIVAQFLAPTAEQSEIVRRPLDPSRGGVYHEGGVIFNGTDEPAYQALLAWAKARVTCGADTAECKGGKFQGLVDKTDDAFVFFANRVQPTLVRKGCMFLGCHSPAMFHDLRLRGGSGGQFSLVATRRNYEMSKLMLAVEAPDPNVSRLINKNLYPPDLNAAAAGSRHRGGPLLEDVPGADHATLADCAKLDAEKGDLNTVPAYCIFAKWHEKERDAAIKKGAAGGGIDKDPLKGIVYVARPANTDRPQQFDTFRGGASLHFASATLDAAGDVTMGGDKDLGAGCGLGASPDVRAPAVSWDGTEVAFAARPSADVPLAIYTVRVDGSGCAKHAGISKHEAKGNGIFIHDLDPAWAPDGTLVFASTRGQIGQAFVEDALQGPSRTPGMLLPNANLYSIDKDSKVKQLTFLLGQELKPAFMRDGRIIFTTEKRAPGFYQLAGRRMNLDGGDYHPLFGQRATSVDYDLKTKIGALGYEQLTEVHELADRSFVGVFSDHLAVAGAGTVGVVNRSLGPDQFDRDPADRFYLHSLTFPDPAATGFKGSAGVYRSPAPLPSHAFLASYSAGDPTTTDGTFELVQIDSHTGARKTLVPKGAGKSIVEAVAVYARYRFPIFKSKLDEPNGATLIEPGKNDAEVTILDLPVLASLLFGNTRTGRPVRADAKALGIVESLPPPNDLTSFDTADATFVATDDYGKVWVKRRRLGVVPTQADGSVGIHLPGGIPILLELYANAADKTPFATQREEMEFLPGERSRIGFRAQFFDSQCGGCHGSLSGREVDVHVKPDVLTAASRVQAFAKESDLFLPGPARGTPFGPGK